MTELSLTVENLTKTFGRRLIFKNINTKLLGGNIYGLAGNNGSGKSTLAKIIAGIISPTSGTVTHKHNGQIITADNLHKHIGFVAPYLILYDEFTAEENIEHSLNIRGLKVNNEETKILLNRFQLYNRRKDLLKGYSSGMKQRIKFIFALLHNPYLLVFDEPTSNLDSKGKDTVYKIIEEEAKAKIVILASNDESDLELCKTTIHVEDFKLSKTKKQT